MKVALVYYSATGNTKLACEYVKRCIHGICIDLIDFMEITSFVITEYDIIGFAFFTDAWQPPNILLEFIQRLSEVQNKYAFALNTFGCISGKSALTISRTLKNKGFQVIEAFSLHAPESYPPMIASGKGYNESPSPSEFRRFQNFINRLQESFSKIARGEEIRSRRPKLKFIDWLVPGNPAAFTRILYGTLELKIDTEACTQCGLCTQYCPVKAISVLHKVHIDQEKCQQCWSCYNHCPYRAVKVGKYTGQGQYRKPIPRYQNKFKDNGKE